VASSEAGEQRRLDVLRRPQHTSQGPSLLLVVCLLCQQVLRACGHCIGPAEGIEATSLRAACLPPRSGASRCVELAGVSADAAAHRFALEYLCARGDVRVLWPEGLENSNAVEEVGYKASDRSVCQQHRIFVSGAAVHVGEPIWQ